MYQVYDDMSPTELEVCTFLKELRIFWNFDQPLFLYDDANRPRLFSPDFFLPELGIYIEVMGNPYLSDYERRQYIYEMNNIPILFIAPNHSKNWKKQILEFIEGVHNERYEKLKRIRNSSFFN